ncbi:MAG: LptE family protein [Phycisphaerae bacterium]
MKNIEFSAICGSKKQEAGIKKGQFVRQNWAMGFLLLGSCFLMSACGYTSHPAYNESVKTVCVPVFENHTFRREWEFRLTEAIDKNIEYRTPYKIASRKDADTILTGELVDVQQSVLTNRFGSDLPRESELTMVVNFVWKDQRSGKILVERKAFNRSATEIPQLGERVTDAEQVAIERLAAAIVDQMQSDWGMPTEEGVPKKQEGATKKK